MDLVTMKNRKAQAFVAIISILFVIFVVAFVVYISSIPKQDSSNINTIILQNNSNYTNQSVIIEPINPIQPRNITRPITKPRVNNTIYPDKQLVRGSILTTNKSIICVSGYTVTVRNVPTRIRKHILIQYGLNETNHGDVEIDHWYPLELGGDNNETNLWVEYAPYYHWKDTVENLVHDKMCNSNMTVDTATGLMWIWYDIYRNKSIVDDYINE